MFSVVAKVIKSKNDACVVAGVCKSSCELSAGWFVTIFVVIGTDAVSPWLVALGCFGCFFKDFFAIVLVGSLFLNP